MRLLDFIIGYSYHRRLSKKVIMIRFVLKRVSVYILGISVHGARGDTKEFEGDIIKIKRKI